MIIGPFRGAMIAVLAGIAVYLAFVAQGLLPQSVRLASGVGGGASVFATLMASDALERRSRARRGTNSEEASDV